MPRPPDSGAAPLDLCGRSLCCDPPLLMGAINVTPDSFSDGGRFVDVDRAVTHAESLVAAGAAILDIGGESTRPGAAAVTVDEELARVSPVIEALAARQLDVAISVDTSKATVAAAALDRGAVIVNDVTAGADQDMAPLIADRGAGWILMHMRGEPRTMQAGPIQYDDVVAEVVAFLEDAVQRAVDAGVARKRLLIDPGIGFGKELAHNLTLTKELQTLTRLGLPVVYGPSRKLFLGEVTGRDVDDRERATAAACALAVLRGASILRIHDVAAVRDAVALATAVRDAR